MKQTKQESSFILVIDDEEAVVDILEFEGLDVITAVDGQTGIDLYKTRQTDVGLVLLDLSMPGLSGAETFQELKIIDPEVKVVLSSGYEEAEVSRHFVGKGLVGFLQKPYNMSRLVHKVQEYLD